MSVHSNVHMNAPKNIHMNVYRNFHLDNIYKNAHVVY